MWCRDGCRWVGGWIGRDHTLHTTGQGSKHRRPQSTSPPTHPAAPIAPAHRRTSLWGYVDCSDQYQFNSEHQHRHHHHHHHHQLSSPCRRVRSQYHSVTQHIFPNSPAITLLWVWTRVGRWSCQCFGRGDVPNAVDTVRPQLEVRLSIPQCRPTRLRSTRTRTPLCP